MTWNKLKILYAIILFGIGVGFIFSPIAFNIFYTLFSWILALGSLLTVELDVMEGMDLEEDDFIFY